MANVNKKIINNLRTLQAYDLSRIENFNVETVKFLILEASQLVFGCHEYFSEHFKELADAEKAKEREIE